MLKNILKTKGYTSIRLKKTKSQHLVALLEVNNTEGLFLIDTGASSSCVHSILEEKFHLRSKGDSFDAAGANKGKMRAFLTRKATLKLGHHDVGKLAFVLLDLSYINETLISQGTLPIEGILGADFLKKKKVSIDYRTQKLWL